MSRTETRTAYRETSIHMNYLYQLAACTLAQNPENLQLVRFYTQTMQSIAKKLVLRIDPSIKRTICKKCCMLLVPGITATVRLRGKKGRKKHAVIRCVDCGTTKRFNSNADYKLWTEQAEALVVKHKKGAAQEKPTCSAAAAGPSKKDAG